MKHLFLAAVAAAAAAAALGACAARPAGEAATMIASAANQPAPAGPEFVRMAGASDLYEIQSSQLLLQGSQNEDLRRFAQMMVDHHTQTTATVRAAAREAGMTPPPPALDAAKLQMIRELQAAQGDQRDLLYMQQQVMAHREALMLHGGYAKAGDTPSLMRAAQAALPIVSRHYNEIVAMQGGAGGGHAGL